MLAAGSTEFDGVADQTRMGIQANTLSQDWNSFFSGFNDDAQWAILGYWKTADYKDAHGEDSTAYKNAALSVYQYVAAQYDTSLCGGGVPWTNGGNYKNAITNELFLTTSAQGYRRTGDQTFLDNAQKIWAWLEQSGIRNSDGLWNDGLDADTCQNNGETTWTYNQGVIASGLGYLGAITGNSTLFSQAELTLDATISKLTENGVLKEACDSPTSSSCGGDGQLFKGIWMKHVQFYLDAVNDASRTAKYSSFLAAQASAIETNALTSDNDIGSLW
ncbi:Six-hairpin glycosidase [Punctularia strigosozonata HHB-11173 SS5]|uniref:Six-hairpin glycosidase n=1 Tax=Punctularia strigosozonata (strain HHB-11173) TaxID=741275 RepID=UPI0004416282|nr:Six-hairpin glycosidase [Punctularia strigosozonata HHB-11173 SS5]EIN11861.1 Six-hairpin glycosidase [Punctularia strigosozonata HHB-11173 SS5]